eukprot:gb/GECG01004239.1/.p1 GENE.gb/GECG01004239.1/~~gb/GECG01004239.1/.p1  ORF type:complete len:487 (+),score=45.07 gb/GECG01004239.1/:1-1461(+)
MKLIGGLLVFLLAISSGCTANEEPQSEDGMVKYTAQQVIPGSALTAHLRGGKKWSKNGEDKPQEVHLALAGQDSEGVSNGMAVSWTTVNATKTSVVKYGQQSRSYQHEAHGTQATYHEGWDYHHHAVMTDLQPDTKYCYVVGDSEAGFSEEFNFVTAPRNDRNRPLKLMVYGDMGVYNSDNTRGAVNRRYKEYEWIWHLGDIGYADDAFLHHITFYYEKIWNQYMNWMQNVSAYKPYMVLPGNHEAECHSLPCILHKDYRETLQNFTAYNYRFRLPWRESGAVSDMWYSFNYGPVHFLNIDTETDFPGAPRDEHIGNKNGGFGDQLKWLEEDLKKANASRHLRPWILAAGHRPVYSIGDTDSTGNITGAPAKLAKAVEDLFYRYQVDIFFCGHKHSYERQWPVYKTVPEKTYQNPRATTYIVNGAAGNTEGHTLYPSTTPDWNVAYNNQDYGYGMLSIYNSTTLHWGFYKSADDTLIDEVTLYRAH